METAIEPDVEVLPERVIDQTVRQFHQALREGQSWFDALLEAIAMWTAPEEVHDGRRYRYLIAGEAFDWMLLAERLVLSADGLIPEAERDALIFQGVLPRGLTDEEFKAAIGSAKYGAVVNYWYGVRVEEGLMLANEYEVRKQRRGLNAEDPRLDDAVFERIYGHGRDEMLSRYLVDRGFAPTDRMSLAELKEFTYWLFKFRVKRSDPARLGSDTKKGMSFLQSLGRGFFDVR